MTADIPRLTPDLTAEIPRLNHDSFEDDLLLEPADVPVDDPADDEAPADTRTGAALDREDLAVYLVGELNRDRHELLLLDRVIDRRKDPKVRRRGVDIRLILPIVRLKGLATRLLV